MPADAITTTDAGSFGQWQQRYLEFDHPNSYISPTLGCMGPGVPVGGGGEAGATPIARSSPTSATAAFS